MTDRLPVRKMNPVCDGKWAGIDVAELLMWRVPYPDPQCNGVSHVRFYDEHVSRRLGIDVASIRRLAGEGE